MTIRWHELEEFPDYAVNTLGEIHNIKTGMPRKLSINQRGNVKISLYKNGKELHTRSVAVLVADAFCEGKTSFFNTPTHLDGDHTNCRADNLAWRPRWFAVQYHRQFFDPQFHNANVRIVEINSGREFYSVKEACMTLGLHHDDVYRSYASGRRIPLTSEEFELLET